MESTLKNGHFLPFVLSFRVIHNSFFPGGTALMHVNQNHFLQFLAGAAMTIAVAAGAQAPATSAPSSDPAPAAAPAAAAQAPAPAAAPAAPAPLSTFVLTGPLQWLPPATFDAGPLGKLSVNGIVTGFSHVPEQFRTGRR